MTKDEQFNQMIEKVGKKLNLKLHISGLKPTEIWTSVDTEGHRGTDGRYYVIGHYNSRDHRLVQIEFKGE